MKVLFNFKIGNLILIFEKVQIKNVNAVIWGKKRKCGRSIYWKQTCFSFVMPIMISFENIASQTCRGDSFLTPSLIGSMNF